MKKIISITVACLFLSGCAHSFVDTYEPIVDTAGTDMNRYYADLQACRQYAVREDPANKALEGAMVGALAGALIGTAVGGGNYAGYGAGIGAAQGGVAGGVGGVIAQKQIVQRCMAGRGWRVIG